MKFLKILSIGLFIAISPVLTAQQMVAGRITDAADGTPVSGASIFIANTTIGTTSGDSGNYSLTVPGKGSFEIVVSHVGYHSVVHKINAPQDAHQYDVALETNKIEEVIIRAAKTYKQKDVNLFWLKILGEKPSRRGMEMLHPEKVWYYLTNDNVLKASCREPIEIINHHTGYRIRYVLQRFEHDYRTNATEFVGMPSFEELPPRDSRQKELWDRKRQEVYAVSLNSFLRALYRNQIHEEGFLLSDKKIRDDGKIIPLPLENILTAGQDIVRLNIREPLFLVCYSQPVTYPMIRDGNWNDILKSNLSGYTTFINTGTGMGMGGPMPTPTTVNYSNSGNSKKGVPVVMELQPSRITVYPNGTYYGTLTIGEVNNKYMGGLSARVPVEYPEIAQNIAYGHTVVPSSNLDKIEENIEVQLETYPQEKIHLHTDRDFYIPGEKIWLKAYVVDANTHQNLRQSWYVYVELINSANTLVNRVMITQTGDGLFHGHLPLTDMVPEGDYTLRAYTRYMENLGDDYFFKKNIRIGNLSAAKNQQPQTAKSSVEKDDFDVSFFPEGGNLPAGVFSKLTFKALNKSGYPETISGIIIDETGAEITSVKTVYAGMGIFSYLPQAGKRYYLKCRNANGVEKQFELPRSNPRTYALSASSNSNHLHIEVKRSVQAPKMTNYILAHCRGTVIHFSEWNNNENGIIFDQEDLPSGVIQFVLFDGQLNLLSERLVFSKNDASVPVDFHTDRNVYQIRDKIVATLSFPDSIFNLPLSLPLGDGRGGASAHFSVAITDDKDIAVDESTTILSSLLLSSDLKGYIENPAYYLQDDVAMDILMMTHGWRRYNVPEVAKGKFENPQIPFQVFQKISGRVTTISSNRPVPNGEILMTTKGGGFGATSTDGNGLFTIPELDFPDSTAFYMQASDNRGRDNVKLSVDSEQFPALVYAPQSSQSGITKTDVNTKDESDSGAFMKKAEQRAKFDEDIWTLQLEEVAITARKVTKVEPRTQFWANASSDQTITRETIEDYKFTDVYSYIYTKGVRERVVDGRKSYYFENNIINFGKVDSAMIIIDGFPANGDAFAVLQPNEVESIDIFKGVGATLFGVRGANGVISVTTRMGGGKSPEKFNQFVYTPLGYQQPAEFYSPKYETLESKRSVIPDYRTTIFWKPDVVIFEDGKTTFEFYTSDFKTTYSVVIEGITSDGRIVRQVEKIRIE